MSMQGVMPNRSPSKTQPGAAILGQQVTKTFESKAGRNHALGPTDFEIKPGEFVSIIGASGCGKSTLMLITAGLIPASEGAVIVDGEKL